MSALRLLVLLALASAAVAVTGTSSTTCLSPLDDVRIETINNPTPVANEIYGLRMAGRGRVLAVCEYLPRDDVSDTIEVYVRDSILDTYGTDPIQSLSLCRVLAPRARIMISAASSR